MWIKLGLMGLLFVSIVKSENVIKDHNTRFGRDIQDDNSIETLEGSLTDEILYNLNNENATNFPDVLSRQQSVQASAGIIRINVGQRSQLLAPPGTTVQIYFEVTNLRREQAVYNFQIVDERSYLVDLRPLTAIIGPGQTITVTAIASIPPNIDIGVRDQITFSASSSGGSASAGAFLTVMSSTGNANQDNEQPWISYSYGSRCGGERSYAGQCASHIWSLELNVHDRETGVLRIDSVPTGVYYRGQFTAGTRDPVSATYSASCCQPRVTITAHDVAGNQRTVTYDVTDIYLDAAGISAIVLGCILIIILIILLILLIRWCVKRRQSRELPVYRTERVT